MNQPFKYLFIIPVAALVSVMMLALASCVSEDESMCRAGVYLHFSYTLNRHNADLFGDEVNELVILVFDDRGLLHDYYLVDQPERLGDDNSIYLPLPRGEWDVIAWGSEQKGFGWKYYGMGTVNPENEESPYNYGIEKGKTHIDEVRLWIKNHTDGGNGHRLVSEGLSKLYFGRLEKLKVRAVEGDFPTQEVSMIEDTNTLRVVLKGAPFTMPSRAPIESFNVTADMRNGRYTLENLVGQYAMPVLYRNGQWQDHGISAQYDMTVLRQFIDDRSSELIISGPYFRQIGFKGGELRIPIVPTILENPNYRSQQDLDREDLYVFTITFYPVDGSGRVEVSVNINGWNIVTVNPGIS